MGTTAPRKPVTIILTEMVRIVMPAPRLETVRRLTLDSWLPRLLPPEDPDAAPGRGRLGMAY